MNKLNLIEKMEFELDGEKFMFLPSTPYSSGEQKKLISTIGMIDMDSGEVVSEIDISIVELMKEDEYVVLAKYRKKLIDQYKESKK